MTPTTELYVPLGPSASRRQAQDWSLVLTAEGIPHQLRRTELGVQLSVLDVDLERSARALLAFERESRAAAAPPPPRVEHGPTGAGFVLAAALPFFFALTQRSALPWLARGSADADAILGGEPWRALTALTLHADAGHVLGNALACALFATLLFRALGPGLGAALLLVAGAGANALSAWLHGSGYASVGFSSALFGAVGVLAGLQFAERWRYRLRRRSAWLPLAAGLGLLAMLGSEGARTDVAAHGLGFLCGVPLGAAAGFGLRRPPPAAVQLALLVGALASLVGAWVLALTR